MQLVVKSQVLAGGRGLGTFKNGLKGGVHIVKADQVEDLAGTKSCLCYIIMQSKFPSLSSFCPLALKLFFTFINYSLGMPMHL